MGLALVPFIMLVEIFSAGKTSITRSAFIQLAALISMMFCRDVGGILFYRKKKCVTDIKGGSSRYSEKNNENERVDKKGK